MKDHEVLSLPEQIRESVRLGRIKETGRLVAEALSQGISGEEILSDALIPGMKQAGNEYRMQEQDIPKLLSAARSMQIGMDAECLYRPFGTLSFGERTRVMLAVLFAGEKGVPGVVQRANILPPKSSMRKNSF